jgi:hypothetical protein
MIEELKDARLQITSETTLVGRDDTDPGVLAWEAQATLDVWPAEDDSGWEQAPGFALSSTPIQDGEGGQDLVIFSARGLVVDLTTVGDVAEALDARSADYAEFIGLFGDGQSFYGQLLLCPELEETLEPLGHQVVIIDRVEMAPAWRGLGGVGRLLIGRVIAWVAAAPRVVAVYPFPIDLEDDARIRRYSVRRSPRFAGPGRRSDSTRSLTTSG